MVVLEESCTELQNQEKLNDGVISSNKEKSKKYVEILTNKENLLAELAVKKQTEPADIFDSKVKRDINKEHANTGSPFSSIVKTY
ncbi:hypothetical protein [Spiroplasma endosymbiont of Nebria brevicollis]|uniref:hypothetical protein n=1 Tax=Spiroplasma endosymbiont of Nebria brevicollis TaxID=3066284 RepID=UPI00313D9921